MHGKAVNNWISVETIVKNLSQKYLKKRGDLGFIESQYSINNIQIVCASVLSRLILMVDPIDTT